MIFFAFLVIASAIHFNQDESYDSASPESIFSAIPDDRLNTIRIRVLRFGSKEAMITAYGTDYTTENFCLVDTNEDFCGFDSFSHDVEKVATLARNNMSIVPQFNENTIRQITEDIFEVVFAGLCRGRIFQMTAFMVFEPRTAKLTHEYAVIRTDGFLKKIHARKNEKNNR